MLAKDWYPRSKCDVNGMNVMSDPKLRGGFAIYRAQARHGVYKLEDEQGNTRLTLRRVP